MKETGYHKAMKREFEGREIPVVKRQRMNSSEKIKALSVRRRLEDIKDRKELNKEWELCL